MGVGTGHLTVAPRLETPFSGSLAPILSNAAATHPHDVALLDGDLALSWRDLELVSRRAAILLSAKGMRHGDRLVLIAPKSATLIAILFAALRLGAVCVPLDVRNPRERITKILADAEPRLTLTSDTLFRSGQLVEQDFLSSGYMRLEDDEIGGLLQGAETAELPDAALTTPQDMALILYTSGSTGAPKGVMLSHGNVASFAVWAQREFLVSPVDRIASVSPLHFDLSTFDLFAGALGGASIALAPAGLTLFPARFVDWLTEVEATVLYTVPTMLAAMTGLRMTQLESLSKLRLILFAGEVFPHHQLAALRRALPHVEFANLFGPTETNVCTFYRIARDANLEDPLPIGIPCPGVECRIGEIPLAEAPEEAGELIVAGPTVAMGYWRDPELTRRRFVRSGEMRAFATGDMASRRADGQLLFHGRKDDLVKVRGHRIALGEIEHVLHGVTGVEAAAVVVSDGRIVCFLVSKLRDEIVDRATEACCRALLPHAVPTVFKSVARLPLGSTGKIDRRILEKWSAV